MVPGRHYFHCGHDDTVPSLPQQFEWNPKQNHKSMQMQTGILTKELRLVPKITSAAMIEFLAMK